MQALVEDIFANLGSDDAAQVCTSLEHMFPVPVDPVSSSMLAHFDGIRAVVGAMRNHSTSSSVQISARAVLMYLSIMMCTRMYESIATRFRWKVFNMVKEWSDFDISYRICTNTHAAASFA